MYKQIAFTFLSKGLVAFINLLILIFSSHWLGAELRGEINLFVLNLSIIHGLNEIYTGFTLVYFIPRFNLKRLYVNGLLWILGLSAVISFFYYCSSAKEFTKHLHLFLLAILLSTHAFNTVILLAKEKIKLFNGINFMQAFLLLLILVLEFLFWPHKGITIYLIALYGSLLPSLMLSCTYVIKIIREEQVNHLSYRFFAILKNGFYNQLASMSHVLSNRLNFYLLGSHVLVGLFGNASSLTESIWLISSSAAPIVLTRISNSEGNVNNSKMAFLVAKICFILSLTFTIILLLIPNFLFVQILGKDFTEVKWLMLNLCPGILCISFATIISHFYSGMGNQRILVIANSIGLIAALCAGIFLIPKFGLLGACYAANSAYFVTTLILTTVFMKAHNLSVKQLFSLDLNALRHLK